MNNENMQENVFTPKLTIFRNQSTETDKIFCLFYFDVIKVQSQKYKYHVCVMLITVRAATHTHSLSANYLVNRNKSYFKEADFPKFL